MPGFFEKFIFELETFLYSIRMALSLVKRLMSPQKMFVLYFDFFISCLYTLNPLSLSLKWVITLVATTYRSMERGQSCETTYMLRVKGSERRPFLFRLNIVLHDLYQADKIVIEIEERKQVPGDCVKYFSIVLLIVLETSIVSSRSCIL